MVTFSKSGQFAKSASASLVVSGLGFRPKAVVFWTPNATADNTISPDIDFGYGFWADNPHGEKGRSYWLYCPDGTVNREAGASRAYPLATRNWQMDIVPDADGFTATWTGTAPTGSIVHFLAFGGDTLRAEIAPATIDAAIADANGTVKEVRGVGFHPTTAFAVYYTTTSGDIGINNPLGIGMGFCDASLGQFSQSGVIGNPANGNGQNAIQQASETDFISGIAFTGARLRMQLRRYVPGGADLEVVDTYNTGTASVQGDILFLGSIQSKFAKGRKPAANGAQVLAHDFNVQSAMFFSNENRFVGSDQDPLGFINWSLGAAHSGGSTGGSSWYKGNSAYVGKGFSRSGYPLNIAEGISMTTMEAQAASAFSGKNITLTWSGNAQETYFYWLAFGDVTKPLEARVSAFSQFLTTKMGNPVMLSAAIRALGDIYPQGFGTVGNLAQVSIGAYSTFDARLQMKAALRATIGAVSIVNPRLRFSHSMHALIASYSTVWGSKPGNPAPLSGAIFAAGSDISARGLRLSHNLRAAIGARSRFTSRFRIIIPSIIAAGPNDIPGVVNLHPNPSAERQGDLIGWFDEDGEQLNIEQSTERSWDGAYSVKHKVASGAGREVVARSFLGLEVTGLATGGVRRRVQGQVRIYAPAGAALEVYLRAYYTDGTEEQGEATPFTGEGGANFPIPTNAPGLELDPTKTLLSIEVVTRTTTGAAFSFYVDGAQLEVDQGYGPTHFAIGSYGGNVGTWAGVPHASMSYRQPVPQVIHAVGRGGEFTVEGKMYRATWDNRWVEDITDMVIDCNVTMDATREVTWSMAANFTWEGYQSLEENLDWLAPVLTITYPDGTVASKQLGLYFLVPGESTRGEYERSVQVSAFDPLWLLAKQGFTGSVRTAKAGVEERMRVVRDILDGAVLTGGDGNGVPPRYSGPNSGKSWRKRREWSNDNDKLSLVNEILQGAAMYPLWTIYNGEIRWRKMGETRMKNRRPVRLWAANLPKGSVITTTIPRVSVLSSEVIGAIKSQSEAMDAYDEILIVNDEPDTRRVRVRGRIRGNKKHKRVVTGRGDNKRTKKLRVPYVDDEATAAEIAAALADELSNRQSMVEISVLPDPRPDYCRETVELAVWDAYGDEVAVGQFEVQSVQFGFTPSTCLQVMKLHKVDTDLTEVVVGVE